MTVLKLTFEQLNKIPRVVVGTYSIWLRGIEPNKHLSKSTFYRHRRILLAYGIDISIPHSNPECDTALLPRVIIEAVPVDTPDWAYERGLVAGFIPKK